MSSSELRKKFLKFFEERGHVIVPSSSLIPDDPSVLLTTAGMQQFKPYFLGQADPIRDFGSRRTASVQKSFRTSDIDEVGDESHLTFFEMLGHFSFGDYFKKETVEWTYEFLTKVLNIDPSRISASVFAGDDPPAGGIPFDQESYGSWSRFLPPDRIKKGGRESNVWGPAGPEGPCGAANEVYVDDLEIATLVFMEYHCAKDGGLTPLPQKGVDVGWGLERSIKVVESLPTIFDTDLFQPIIAAIEKQSAVPYSLHAMPYRIIADHMRASVFLIADGVRPSNIDRGYILRRLLRRAARHSHTLSLKKGWYDQILQSVASIYRDPYPEVSKTEEIRMVIATELEKFEQALERGLREFEKVASRGAIPARAAFDLYQSYGFPIEIIEELAREQGVVIDRKGFDEEFKKHQEISKAGKEQKFGGHGLAGVSDEEARKDLTIWKMTRLHTATHLLHQALRDVLGAEVKQKGSDITLERTRFDFTFSRRVSAEELKKIEGIVNQKIKENLAVERQEMLYQEALRQGALAFFKEKYPETVSVYSIGAYSKELCGGPHVSRTSEIGNFKITKEESVAQGVRRIRGVIDDVK